MSIHYIGGPMYAGKTKMLMAMLEKNLLADEKCIVIKHKKDNRYETTGETEIISNSGNHFDQCEIVKYSSLKEFYDNYRNILVEYNCIAISEGQFFEDLVKYCLLFRSLNIEVIVEGLLAYSNQELFNSTSMLIPHVTKYTNLTSVCEKCKDKNAVYTINRKTGGPRICIGGKEMYSVICAPCYDKIARDKWICDDN